MDTQTTSIIASIFAIPTQIDTDADGYGNICDADFNNDAIVNGDDLAQFRSFFGSRNTGSVADLNGDDFVNTSDLAIFRRLFGRKPGPSGSILSNQQ